MKEQKKYFKRSVKSDIENLGKKKKRTDEEKR